MIMRTTTYDISTGRKEDFYTLWATTIIDLRPRDSEGNILSNFRVNAVGGNMYYFVRIRFVQNLAKTRKDAISKVREMGLDIPESQFNDDLKHYTKPSYEAFGARLKFKNDKWYAKATPEFFACWRENKQVMKDSGWTCWKHNDDWYMAIIEV